jgi:hypothetical protein
MNYFPLKDIGQHQSGSVGFEAFEFQRTSFYFLTLAQSSIGRT